MRRLFVITVAGMLAGCGQASPFFKCPHPEFSADDYQMAAFNAVGNIDTLVLFYDPSYDYIGRVDAEVAKLRPWVAKMNDVCMRDAANNWLDFFERDVRRNRKSAQEYQSNQAERDREEMEQARRQQELLSAMKLPPKPE